MKRIVAGIILTAIGFAWVLRGPDGAVIIVPTVMVILGVLLFGLGMRHWWISRR
jgi:hypothetical protein